MTDSDNHDEINELDQEPEEPEEQMTEAQWLERWNQQFEENLYLDASEPSSEEDEAQEEEDDQFAVEDDDLFAVEDEESDEQGGFAAYDGSWYV